MSLSALPNDVVLVLGESSDLQAASALACACRDHHKALRSQLAQRRQVYAPYNDMVRVLCNHYRPMYEVHRVGLRDTMLQLLVSGQFSWRDILRMEDPLPPDVAHTALGLYTQVSGQSISLTVGSVVKNLTANQPIAVYLSGYTHMLRVYHATTSGRITLPCTRDSGGFYSRGGLRFVWVGVGRLIRTRS